MMLVLGQKLINMLFRLSHREIQGPVSRIDASLILSIWSTDRSKIVDAIEKKR